MSKDRKFLPEVNGIAAVVFTRFAAEEAAVRVDQKRAVDAVCGNPQAIHTVARTVEISERSRRAGPTRS